MYLEQKGVFSFEKNKFVYLHGKLLRRYKNTQVTKNWSLNSIRKYSKNHNLNKCIIKGGLYNGNDNAIANHPV